MTLRWVFRAVLFCTTVAAAFAFLHFVQGGAGGVVAFAAEIPLRRWAALGAGGLAIWLLDCVRTGALLSLLGLRPRFALLYQLVTAGVFVSTLTPSAELQAPALAWRLQQEGMPAAEAFAAILVKSLYMTLWICAFGFAAIQLQGGVLFPAGVAHKMSIASLWLLVPSSLFGAILLRPGRVQAWADARLATSRGARRKLIDFMARAAAAAALVGRSRKLPHLVCHAASLFTIVAYALVGWSACNALGIALDLPRALAVFGASLLVAYLAPVPGGIGVTELTMSYLIDPSLTPRATAAAILIRFVTWYAAAAQGAIALWIWALRSPPSRTTATAYQEPRNPGTQEN